MVRRRKRKCELEVYKRSYSLALKIHKLTQTFPEYERYEIGNQLRKAATSIVLNIVEGYGRRESKAEFQHFLRNAIGSCNETRVLIDIAKALNYINDKYAQLTGYKILSKQMYRLRQSVKN